MNFTQPEIQILREANEILKLHNFKGSSISRSIAPMSLINWLNEGSLGIDLIDKSPLETIIAYYDANPNLENLQQVREIDFFQLGHNKQVCYLSESRMNEEQLKKSDMFQHFKRTAFLHIGFIPSAGLITWRLFCKKSPTEMKENPTNAYHINFGGSFGEEYPRIEYTRESDIRHIVELDFFRDAVLSLEKEKFISKNKDILFQYNVIQSPEIAPQVKEDMVIGQQITFLDYIIKMTSDGLVLMKETNRPMDYEGHLGNYSDIDAAKKSAVIYYMIARPQTFATQIFFKIMKGSNSGCMSEYFKLKQSLTEEGLTMPEEITPSKDGNTLIQYKGETIKF